MRKRVLVSGRVQGVFFRDTCRRIALENGVAGTARNLHDGRVEIVLEGEPDAIDRVVEWAHRGTDWSDVSQVEVIEEPVRGESGFTIR